MRLLLIAVAIYAIVVLLAFVFQRRLIYVPARLDAGVAAARAQQQLVLPWRTRAGETIGWQWPAAVPSAGAVLVVHGNAGSAIDRGYLADPIRRAAGAAGIDVFVLEYPGYGARAGTPSQSSILAAAEQALGELAARRPIYIASESIGAGPAAHLAGTFGDRVSGVLMFAPFNNLQAVAQKAMPFLPAKWLLRDRFDPAAWLTAFSGPVAIVLAGSDEVIPSAFGRALYDSYRGPKRLQVIDGAYHNDIAEQPVPWWQDVFAFWRQHERG